MDDNTIILLGFLGTLAMFALYAISPMLIPAFIVSVYVYYVIRMKSAVAPANAVSTTAPATTAGGSVPPVTNQEAPTQPAEYPGKMIASELGKMAQSFFAFVGKEVLPKLLPTGTNMNIPSTAEKKEGFTGSMTDSLPAPVVYGPLPEHASPKPVACNMGGMKLNNLAYVHF